MQADMGSPTPPRTTHPRFPIAPPPNGQYYISFVSGSSQYVALPSITIPSSDGFTICFWGKAGTNTSYARFFDMSNYITPTTEYKKTFAVFISPVSGQLIFEMATDNPQTRQDTTYAVTVTDNTWRHYAWSCSTSGTSSIYVNGSFYTSGSITYSTASGVTMPYVYIAKSTYSTDPAFTGSVNMFEYYSKVLSASQISSIYNGSIPS